MTAAWIAADLIMLIGPAAAFTALWPLGRHHRRPSVRRPAPAPAAGARPAPAVHHELPVAMQDAAAEPVYAPREPFGNWESDTFVGQLMGVA